MNKGLNATDLPEGVAFFPHYFDETQQATLVETLRLIVSKAPLYQPTMPRTGKPLSVSMTNCGSLGWITDKDGGYRYQAHHPTTKAPWPPIPDILNELWHKISNYSAEPEACLINFYNDKAKMGLHQDRDEQNFDAPVISVSLGDDARFKIGGLARIDKVQSMILRSGDLLVMGGKSRLVFHGIDRIYAGTSTLLKSGGRINLTLRRVNR